jgi:asparagine synthase (glutamine-hydrolysing)
MCGIAGFLDPKRRLSAPMEQILNMLTVLAHRGPDNHGVWFDSSMGIGLGHRRLSIMDLSSEGNQPMVSRGGRYVIAYNGEIYNHREVRKDLEKSTDELIVWRGHSDTEVLLAAIEEWGLNSVLRRINGMFAFVLWDRKEQILHLARDRMGEKPLYYGWVGDTLLFASELKALKAIPLFSGEIDRNALSLFIRYNYIPYPYSIYKGFYKLPQASILSIPQKYQIGKHGFFPYPDAHDRGGLSPVTYWSMTKVATQSLESRFNGTYEEIIGELEKLMLDAVELRMEADVPLGAFLSSGIDSSLVVALMQRQSSRPIKTFSIGSNNRSYDEAQDARVVANYLGTDHTQLYISPQEALQVIPLLPRLYDEPFADSSQIPTYLVSELARRQVVVSLSGDGGDELFAGYNRHFISRKIWNKIRHIPKTFRKEVSTAMMSIPTKYWDKVLSSLGGIVQTRFNANIRSDRLHKLALIIGSSSPEEMYLKLVSNWAEPESVVVNCVEPSSVVMEREQWPDIPDFTERMMFLDLVTYLPDDILVKVDRASMGVGLESRVPFLDHRVVEFSWKVPIWMKIKNGKGKWIIRQILKKYLPQEVVERPKKGFDFPINNWLRGSLRDWAESLLDSSRIQQEGYLNSVTIEKEWRRYLSCESNSFQRLWSICMFQAWLECEKKQPYTTQANTYSNILKV